MIKRLLTALSESTLRALESTLTRFAPTLFWRQIQEIHQELLQRMIDAEEQREREEDWDKIRRSYKTLEEVRAVFREDNAITQRINVPYIRSERPS